MRKYYWLSLIPIVFVIMFYGIEFETCHDFYAKLGEVYDLDGSGDLFGGVMNSANSYIKDQCNHMYLETGYTLIHQLFESELFLIDEKYIQNDLEVVTVINNIYYPNKIQYCGTAITIDQKEFGLLANYSDGIIIDHSFTSGTLICE